MWCSFNIISVATKPPVMNQAVNLIINRESHSFFRGEINNFHLVQSPKYLWYAKLCIWYARNDNLITVWTLTEDYPIIVWWLPDNFSIIAWLFLVRGICHRQNERSFSIFDFYGIKTLWFEFGNYIFTGNKMPTL